MYSGQDGNNVVGPGGVGVGSGAPISSGQGMMPNRPIASGGGDIVLNNSGDQKSKKDLKWAIGIIVGVLILAGVGVGVWWGMTKSGNLANDNLTEKELFNEYANYLFNAEESAKDISLDTVDGKFYFEREAISSDEKKIYLSKLNEKFDKFINVYYAQPDAVVLDGLLSYTYYFAGLDLPSEQEILEWYFNDGLNATEIEINSKYKVDFNDDLVSRYVGYEKEMAELFLSMLVSANNAGCIKNNAVDELCSSAAVSDEIVEKYEEVAKSANDIYISLHYDAHEALDRTYDNIYGLDDEGDSE